MRIARNWTGDITLDLPQILWIGMLIAGMALSGCQSAGGTENPNSSSLENILQSGEITVITRNNAHSYYLYRDQIMGFQYDLAKAFADYLGVKLKVKIIENWEAMLPSVMDGTADFIAANISRTAKRQKQLSFSDGYMEIRQHIIVHRDNTHVRKLEDLAGQTVCVTRGTAYQEHLEELRQKNIDVHIELVENVSTEELIRQVAEKDLDITIADSNIALLNRRYYPQSIIAGSISKKEVMAWAVHPGAYRLLNRMNSFFKKIKANGQFSEIYNRYYADVDSFDYVDLRIYHRRLNTRLPKYKPLIETAAGRFDFDWRLIAAQMYQESHFNPRAKSHAGAFGLMQLTPATAKSLGVKDFLNPEENINAGVKHLKGLFENVESTSESDRLFIALAAYNVGQGHIQDARVLARKMKLDPNKWSSLEKTLPLLSDPRYYQDARYGYCRGSEPIDYIKQIMIYYDILKHQGIEYLTDSPWYQRREQAGTQSPYWRAYRGL